MVLLMQITPLSFSNKWTSQTSQHENKSNFLKNIVNSIGKDWFLQLNNAL